MSPKRRKGRPAQAAADPREAGAPEQGQDAAGAGAAPTQYIFTFELIRHYPTVRSFLVKQRLKRSFGDTVSEFFGGNKKGAYRV
jgi:hypothetical protein